ncbi:MAG: RnfABCDGE type electron transport complex subunit A [Methanocellales archaeon]|nr:RnfABCDGE type electron transport complex subunit A [Methanocellales archaeon]MDD3292017.1 RnfABCDGE type electron transport complex subunit A [Methanocellales archaeon]MDD5235700.1 RnfABCDGE type electron transport complex subunit A [Methanocellales archaeon]MDD5485626.1 RnfABCDGE type electron transport complex subunit A [Methanocellales archaeon]
MPTFLPTENLLELLIAGIFTKNFLLVMFLGLCSFLGLTKDMSSSIGMSMAVTFVTGMASIITWPIFHFILVPSGLEFLQTICFILVIAAFVQLVEFIIRKHQPALYRSLGIYLPLITTNCAVLGVVLLNAQQNYSYVGSTVYGISAGLGYGLVMLLAAGIREKLLQRGVDMFGGFTGAFIVAALLSLIFVNYFGVIQF